MEMEVGSEEERWDRGDGIMGGKTAASALED